jgi:hypothetical protein
MAQLTRDLFKADADLMRSFNTLAGGKWEHFQDQSHIGYTSWRDPPENSLNAIKLTEIQVPAAGGLGVAVEGSALAWPGAAEEPALPRFDSLGQQRYYVDVFNRGRAPYAFLASANVPWITLSAANGQIEKDTRLWVSVDWTKAPIGTASGEVTVSAGDRAVSIRVEALRSADITRLTLRGFAETQGYVSIAPEHFVRNIDAGEARWIPLEDYGRTSSGMRATAPVDAPAFTPGGSSPRLEYQMSILTAGAVTTTLTVGPTLNFAPGRPLRVAVSFDEQAPQILTVVPEKYDGQNGNRDWEESVRNNARVVSSSHTIAAGGPHTLKVWMIDPGVVVQKIVVDTAASRRAASYLGPPESPRGR